MTRTQQLKWVFKDIQTCNGYSGAMKVIAYIEDSVTIKQNPGHLKQRAEIRRGVTRNPETAGCIAIDPV